MRRGEQLVVGRDSAEARDDGRAVVPEIRRDLAPRPTVAEQKPRGNPARSGDVLMAIGLEEPLGIDPEEAGGNVDDAVGELLRAAASVQQVSTPGWSMPGIGGLAGEAPVAGSSRS